MQLLSCQVSVAGDDDCIVVKDHDTAVTFPELLVLKALHGEESVRNVAEVGDIERDPEEERQRLQGIYGAEIVRQVFPVMHQALPEADQRMRRAAAEVIPKELQEDEQPPAAERHATRHRR